MRDAPLEKGWGGGLRSFLLAQFYFTLPSPLQEIFLTLFSMFFIAVFYLMQEFFYSNFPLHKYFSYYAID